MAEYGLDTLRTMQLYGAVARLGSFSAAGRLLGMAPSSVSRRIDALEAAMGVQLIRRTSRKLMLTDAGVLYYEGTKKILKELEDLNNVISDNQQSPKGLLHVHTRTRIAVDLLNPALPEFLRRYPDIKLKLWLDEERHDLIENQIDIAIRIGDAVEPSLHVRKLIEGEERVLVASPNYLSSHPPIKAPEDLLQHNCLTWDLNARNLADSNTWYFRNEAGIKSYRVTGSLFVNNADVLKSAVLSDIGLTVLPGWCVMEELQTGQMVRILEEYEVTSTVFDHCIYAVFEKTPYMPRKVRVFLDYLYEYFKTEGSNLIPALVDET